MSDEAQNIIEGQAVQKVGEQSGTQRGGLVTTEMKGLLGQHKTKEAMRIGKEQGRGIKAGERLKLKNQFAGTPEQSQVDNAMNQHNRFLREGLQPTEQTTFQDAAWKALQTSDMGNAFVGITDQGFQRVVGQSMLEDDAFRALYQDKAHEAATATFNPSPSEIEARVNAIRAQDPAKDEAVATAEARTALLAEWRADAAEAIKLDNVMQAAVDTYIATTIQKAQEASDKGDELVNGEFDKTMLAKIEVQRTKWYEKDDPSLKKRWQKKDTMNKGHEAAKQSFDAFVKEGGKAAWTSPPPWDDLSAEQQKQFEQKYGEKVITARMGAGKLSPTDLEPLKTADWLGDTPAARVDAVRGMLQTNPQWKRLLDTHRANGTITETTWNKIKAASPYAAAGMLAALLASLAFPLSLTTAIMTGVGAAGAGAAGASKFAFDSREAA
ncbi:MAG: hypothetical protein ACREHC_05680 [Candidatus Levyibacteriota bacterium]